MMEKRDWLDKWHQDRISNWLPYFESLVKRIEMRPSLVLDIGCSDGLLLQSFHRLGIKGYGVDVSKDSLSYAPDEIRSNLILMDIEKENLPFEDNTFDLITILEVLEHLHEHERIISEMNRVLKSNGVVLMSSPVESKALKLLNKLLIKMGSSSSKAEKETVNQDIHDYDLCNYDPHINVHPKRFWIKEFESRGFRFVEDFKHTHKSLIKQIIALHEPKEKIAKFLTKFGTLGKKTRVELAYHLWSSTLLFRKEM